MKRKRTSIVWKIPSSTLIEIVRRSNSLTEILIEIGLPSKGGNSKTLKTRLNEENIDYSHIQLGCGHNKNKKFPNKAISLSKVLVKNSKYDRRTLKSRLIKEKILPQQCAICGLTPIWENSPLVLILDHINGESDDNRIENLRLVCPNCNSQLETHCGKHKRKIIHRCEDCGIPIHKSSDKCLKCSGISRCKVLCDKNTLYEQLKHSSFSCVGATYGVSDNAIRRWCDKFEIPRHSSHYVKFR